jgi:prepilin-type N-terminal cleavage/methylation domain-containing protein
VRSGSEGKIRPPVAGGGDRSAGGRWKKSGFTLIEMSLVLLLLSFTVLLVLPRMQPLLQSTRKEASMRRIAGFLDGVRTRAVSTGRTLTLTRDEEENRLVVRDGREGEGSVDFIEVPGAVGSFTLEPKVVRYFPQGHSSGLVMTFLDEEQRLSRIEVGSFTGLSRISR